MTTWRYHWLQGNLTLTTSIQEVTALCQEIKHIIRHINLHKPKLLFGLAGIFYHNNYSFKGLMGRLHFYTSGQKMVSCLPLLGHSLEDELVLSICIQHSCHLMESISLATCNRNAYQSLA